MEGPIDPGFIYVLIRMDFIEKKQFVYKIGYTYRYPPHKRLWDYPFGSLFLAFYKVNSCQQFETLLKNYQKRNPKMIWRRDLGIEYFEGDLQIIIDIIILLYPLYKHDDVKIIGKQSINENYLQLLNGIKYFPNYDTYKHLFIEFQKYQLPLTNTIILQKDIYLAFFENKCSHKEYMKEIMSHYPDLIVKPDDLVIEPETLIVKPEYLVVKPDNLVQISEAEIVKPELEVIKSPRYYCKLCNFCCINPLVIIRHENTQKHQNNIKGIKNNYCEICSDQFASDSSWKRHMQKSHPQTY
jgi:hypothetical protein